MRVRSGGLTLWGCQGRLEPGKIQHLPLPIFIRAGSLPFLLLHTPKFKAKLIRGVTTPDPAPGRSTLGCQEQLQPLQSIPGMGAGVKGGIPIPSSVISHDGERPQLAELGVVLPLPLLIAQPGPVDLSRQVPKNLVHLRVVDNLCPEQ